MPKQIQTDRDRHTGKAKDTRTKVIQQPDAKTQTDRDRHRHTQKVKDTKT